MRRNVLMLAVAGTLLVASGTASALTRTTTLGVSAVVNPNCLINSQNLNFGSYDGTAARTGTADITVRCSNLTPYSVSLSTGGGTYAQRLLAGSGPNRLQYNLFTSAAATTIWGDGTLSTGTVDGIGGGMSVANERLHTVHGQLPNSVANQDAPTGTYTDSITVTITY